jgi:hypothetical protein
MTYYIGPQISDNQKQIILGTVLGGSSIIKPTGGRNSYLSMRGKEAYWLEYKSHELKDLASPNPFLIEKDNKYFRWHSLCYPVFNDFYSMFYNDKGKTVTMDTLNELRDIGLAVWFIDGGKLEKGSVVLNTTVFGEEYSNIISQYFCEVTLPSYVKVKGKSCKVILTPPSTLRFLRTIVDKVPNFMRHRLVE